VNAFHGFATVTTIAVTAADVQGESIEVLYANIRLAVYQPCEGKDTKVVLHFHLKHPIMVGKKAHKDIQVGDSPHYYLLHVFYQTLSCLYHATRADITPCHTAAV
jgi:hypothetical protein